MKLLYLRDREKFPYKAQLENHINGEKLTFYYNYQQLETMENSYEDNKQTLILTCTIEIQGNPKIIVGDKITLQNKHIFKVSTISPVYKKCNPLLMPIIKLKPSSVICELR